MSNLPEKTVDLIVSYRIMLDNPTLTKDYISDLAIICKLIAAPGVDIWSIVNANVKNLLKSRKLTYRQIVTNGIKIPEIGKMAFGFEKYDCYSINDYVVIKSGEVALKITPGEVQVHLGNETRIYWSITDKEEWPEKWGLTVIGIDSKYLDDVWFFNKELKFSAKRQVKNTEIPDIIVTTSKRIGFLVKKKINMKIIMALGYQIYYRFNEILKNHPDVKIYAAEAIGL